MEALISYGSDSESDNSEEHFGVCSTTTTSTSTVVTVTTVSSLLASSTTSVTPTPNRINDEAIKYDYECHDADRPKQKHEKKMLTIGNALTDLNAKTCNSEADSSREAFPCLDQLDYLDAAQHKSPTQMKQLDQVSNSFLGSYFGLISDSTETENQYRESSFLFEQEERHKKEVIIEGKTVEVPESDFWKDFSVDDVTVDSIDYVSRRKRMLTKIDSHETAKRPAYGKSVNSTPNDRQKWGNCSQSQQQYKIASRNVNCAQEQHKLVQSQNSVNCTSSSSAVTVALAASGFVSNDKLKKVKVYIVHPSISPHLHCHQGNRCPSKEASRWAGHRGAVNRIAWCTSLPFSHLLASVGADTSVRVWNAWGQHEPCVRTLTIHSKATCDVQWSGDGKHLLTSSFDRTAAVTDVETGQLKSQLDHCGFVSCGKYHPVTPHLAATGTTGQIQVWDLRQPDVPVRIFTHKQDMGQVQDLLFTSDGQELFSCGDVVTRESADRSIMAWDWRTGVVLSNQIFQERYTVTRLVLHPSQSQFLAQTQAGYIALFSTQHPYKMNKMKRFEGHKTQTYNIGLSLSADGSLVYSGSSDHQLYCYNYTNAKHIRNLYCGQVALDVAAHPLLPSVVAVATGEGDILIFQ